MGYDSYLAGYKRHTQEVWCKNPDCDNHRDSTWVTYEEEYGAGWTTPDECGRCGSEWMFSEPPEQEDEHDDQD